MYEENKNIICHTILALRLKLIGVSRNVLTYRLIFVFNKNKLNKNFNNFHK